MIFVTGDTHNSFYRLSPDNWKEGDDLSRNDYVIVTGDFGLPFSREPDKVDLRWFEWLAQRPFTVLFVDGNHENFGYLSQLPVEKWNGGKTHVLSENIRHLMRGQMFDIPLGNGDTYRLFAFGGASSYPNPSLWEEEIPSYLEFQEALDTIDRSNGKVDMIISHDCPEKILLTINPTYVPSRASAYCTELSQRLDFKRWCFGHHHEDRTFSDDRYKCFYLSIEQIA